MNRKVIFVRRIIKQTVMPEPSKKQQLQRNRMLLLAYAALAAEHAAAALLPAVFREMGAALHASPTALGSIALSRSVVQAACYPVAAYLASRHDRFTIIALGAFLWAAASFLIALSTTLPQMAFSAALSGVGLAMQIPAIHAFVADSVDDTSRGAAFGWLTVAGRVGAVGGTTLGLLMAPTSLLGVPGWRLAFLLLAGAGAAVAAASAAAKARHRKKKPAAARRQEKEMQPGFTREAMAVMRIPSFQVIVAQGLVGAFPGSAQSFTAMWLELVGFSHAQTAALMALSKLASSLGGLLGGRMGDALAGRFRFSNSGRIVLSQISATSAVPLAAVLLLALRNDPTAPFRHGAALFALGAMTSWSAPATNGPILAEIVPPRSRTTVYALHRTFEAVPASFAPAVVGILADRLYGYKGASDAAEKATSLARAMYTATAIPMTLCCFIYTFLYCTYPRDRDMALASARNRKRSETDED